MCEVHQQSRLERLCRHIARPPIATKRLSVDRQGRVVYRYKRQFAPWNDSLRAQIYSLYSYFASAQPDPVLRMRLQQRADSLYAAKGGD